MGEADYARAQAAAVAIRNKDRRFTLGLLAAIAGLLLAAIAVGPSAAERRAADEREFREHVQSLPEQQERRESDRFWNAVGIQKSERHP